MSTLQQVRTAYEVPIKAALSALQPPIPVYIDNQLYDDNDATTEFAILEIGFGDMTALNLQPCGDSEWIRGFLVLNIYVPKGTGPGRAQEASQVVWGALELFNKGFSQSTGVTARITQLSGPNFYALPNRPLFAARISTGIRARVD
jgi:hypothetical protein